MVHSFMIALALRFVVDVLGWTPERIGWRPLLYACSTAATLVVAWASYRWLESPLLALKRRFEVVHSGG
jgi:peptidoglycan/LPS O-acetylase OafA/YrhL